MDSVDFAEGQWIPLLEYAVKTGTSVSTIRRHIKARKLKFRSENGRYQIWMSGGTPSPTPTVLVTDPYQLGGAGIQNPGRDDSREIIALREKLEQANTEIAELKTLIAYYESALKGN